MIAGNSYAGAFVHYGFDKIISFFILFRFQTTEVSGFLVLIFLKVITDPFSIILRRSYSLTFELA